MPWTETRIYALLEARYTPPEWVVIPNLRTTVGYSLPGRESYLDAFAMRCWPGKGLTRLAFEIKVSRSDWLRELQDPAKRENGMKVSHEFWFVAPSGVVKPGEVPEGCGWMEANKSGLRTRVAAKYAEAPPIPEDFLASLLRSAREPLSVKEAKAFKFAGRDLTVEEFIDASKKELQLAADRLAREKAKAIMRDKPEYRLGAVVRKVMGWPTWKCPTETEFRSWLESVTMGKREPANGGQQVLLRAARNLVSRMESGLDLAQRLRDKLDPGV